MHGRTDPPPCLARRRNASARQFELLRLKYLAREPGRIRLPGTAGELWAQHKYSMMARDPGLYRTVGRRVARLRGCSGFDDLATDLVEILQREPGRGRLTTALEHLWGYVNEDACAEDKRCALGSPAAMIQISRSGWRCGRANSTWWRRLR
jgi:uncharacterized protein YbgA (DUF1722 family)